MIKKCSNCKHHAGISFDFWCGAGHTKYESLGTTDCPYFKYHDWSKGIPCRDEFIEDVLNSIDNKITSDELNEIIELFNEKEKKIQALEIENKELHTKIKRIKRELK